MLQGLLISVEMWMSPGNFMEYRICKGRSSLQRLFNGAPTFHKSSPQTNCRMTWALSAWVWAGEGHWMHEDVINILGFYFWLQSQNVSKVCIPETAKYHFFFFSWGLGSNSQKFLGRWKCCKTSPQIWNPTKFCLDSFTHLISIHPFSWRRYFYNIALLQEIGFLRAAFWCSKDLRESLWVLGIIYSWAAEIFYIQ